MRTVARKDRDRARKRHAIERSRRESGFEPKPKDEQPNSDKRVPSRSRPQRGQATQLRKLQMGDVDRRGRVFKRNMVLHPRIALYLSIAVIVAAVVGLFRPRLQWLSYLAFSVGFLVFADLRPTWLEVGRWVAIAVVCAAASVILL